MVDLKEELVSILVLLDHLFLLWTMKDIYLVTFIRRNPYFNGSSFLTNPKIKSQKFHNISPFPSTAHYIQYPDLLPSPFLRIPRYTIIPIPATQEPLLFVHS